MPYPIVTMFEMFFLKIKKINGQSADLLSNSVLIGYERVSTTERRPVNDDGSSQSRVCLRYSLSPFERVLSSSIDRVNDSKRKCLDKTGS